MNAPVRTAPAEELCATELSATEAAPWFGSLVDRAVGIVRDLRLRDEWSHDEPRTIMYRAELTPTAAHSSGGYRTVHAEAGRAVTHASAEASALFEAVERYCASIYDAGGLRVASHRDLTGAGVAAIDPAGLVAGPEGTRLRTAPLAWTPATSVLSGDRVLVPAQLVYLPYRYPADEARLRDPLTTGCAAGTAIGPATLRGLLEVVERDATMIHHYRRIVPARLPHTLFRSAAVTTLVEQCLRYRLDVEFFDFSLDHPVPVVAVRVRDRSGGVPAMTFGSKASFDAEEAAAGALLEAVTFRPAMRARASFARSVADRLAGDPGAIRSGSERAFYWIQPERTGDLGYLDAAADRDALPARHVAAPGPAEVGELLRHTVAAGGDVLRCDLTTPDLAEYGAYVVKTVVPGLQPMHLSEVDRSWSPRILHAGIAGSAPPGSAAALNPVPHPFL
jgi:ribosomal protein S12 methylthiotransferase accessory factor